MDAGDMEAALTALANHEIAGPDRSTIGDVAQVVIAQLTQPADEILVARTDISEPTVRPSRAR
jgi:hypothetical protein